MIDLRHLESHKARRDYQLRCPECGQWVRALVIVDTGELICRSCWRLIIEHAGIPESVAHGTRDQGKRPILLPKET